MSSPELSSPPRRQYWVFLVPLCFALLAGLLYVGLLHGDASVLPSALIGRPVPTMALAFTLLFVTLHMMAMRNEILRRRIRTMRLMAASATPAPVPAMAVEA